MYNFTLNDPHFLPHSGSQIDFSLAPQEVVAITGANGVGKTTLLHRLYEEHAQIMTLVDQAPLDQFYDRSVGAIKEVFLKSQGARINEGFFQNTWKLFGLDYKSERMQSALSGGESQMLKISLGLAPKAEIYLLDEPSHFLDVAMKKKLNSVLLELLSLKKNLIIVEHDLSWITFPLKVIELKESEGIVKVSQTWTT